MIGWACIQDRVGLYSRSGGPLFEIGWACIQDRVGLYSRSDGPLFEIGWACIRDRVGLYSRSGEPVFEIGWACIRDRVGLYSRSGGHTSRQYYICIVSLARSQYRMRDRSNSHEALIVPSRVAPDSKSAGYPATGYPVVFFTGYRISGRVSGQDIRPPDIR